MNILKKIPLSFEGELHDVRLIQFSIDKKELRPLVPPTLPLYDFNGRALVSMVNVKLPAMKPQFAKSMLKFGYQHIGFRVVVDDSDRFVDGKNKGLYFLRSFTDKPLMVMGANMLTSFNMSKAKIHDEDFMFELRQGNHYLHYAIEKDRPETENEQLFKVIKRVNRAYSQVGGMWRETLVHRKEWPIEWVNCYHFETNFFETARLEGAFIIRKPVRYTWLAPQKVDYYNQVGRLKPGFI